MTLAEPQLSPYAERSTTPSPVARMMSSFATQFREGFDANLGVGYVNESTLPREPLRHALHVVLGDPERYKHALNYGPAAGSENLATSMRHFLTRSSVGGLSQATLDRCRLVLGANGATSLLEGIAATVRRGIVVTADPLYYIYSSLLDRLGFELLPIPEDEAGIRTDLLEARLAPVLDQVSFVYVVTIGNPSASVLRNARRRELVRVLSAASRRVGRKIPLVLDSAYELLRHDPSLEPAESALSYDDLGIVYELHTLSKVLAPALRVGCLLGPPGPVMDVVVQRNNDVGLGASLLTQELASVLVDEAADEQVRIVNAGYREKAIQTRRLLDEHLGESIEHVVGGRAGFYYYVTLRDVATGEDSPCFRYCTRTTGDEQVDGPVPARNRRVAYVPGSFCVHPTGELAARGRRQLRISYGFESLEQIAQGVEILRQAVAYARALDPTGK